MISGGDYVIKNLFGFLLFGYFGPLNLFFFSVVSLLSKIRDIRRGCHVIFDACC